MRRFGGGAILALSLVTGSSGFGSEAEPRKAGTATVQTTQAQGETSEAPPGETQEAILVEIDAKPAARVFVDGKLLGTTPILDLPLAPGIHGIQLEFEPGVVARRVVNVDKDNRSFLFQYVPSDS